MKKLLLLTTLITFVLGVSAQTTVFEDDFESYTLGVGVAEQSDTWTTWSDAPGTNEDALASDDYAQSGSNAMKVHEPTTSSANDMLLPLGNKTSGVYEVNFSMYVESEYGAHFNIQHFEAPGNEWAFQTYFNGGGDGMLQANGDEIDFSYPVDTWFLVELDIDIESDETVVTIDGTDVSTFPFSVNWEGNAGTNQLGSLNIFAGVHSDATVDPLFYIDDVEYIEIDSGLEPPTISVDTDELIVYETGSGVDSEVITLENNGEQELNYHVYPVYPQFDNKTQAIDDNNVSQSHSLSHKLASNNLELSPERKPVSNPIDRDGTLTHVISNLGGGVGYPDETVVRAGVKFRPADLEPFIGMKIEEVIIYHYHAPMNNDGTLKIWDRGEFITPGPGEILHEQNYTTPGDGQFNVTIDGDIYLTGKDLWVGYEITDPGADVYPLGMDEGPQVDKVNYTSTGPGWTEFENSDPQGDPFGNLGIIVELVGDGMPSWMSMTPASGSIEAGGSEEILVDFSTAGLDNGVYEAEIHIAANDPANQYTAIPVTLDISTAIIDGIEEKVGVMTYPNPAVDNLNVKSNEIIETVKVINQVGQVVYEGTPNTESFSINTSKLEKGMYMVQVQTVNSETITHKVVVK